MLVEDTAGATEFAYRRALANEVQRSKAGRTFTVTLKRNGVLLGEMVELTTRGKVSARSYYFPPINPESL